MPKPSGILCPLCDRMQILNSEMFQSETGGRNEGRIYFCSQNHRLEYTKLMAMQPRMRQLQITEKQPVGTVVEQVWMYPEVRQRLSDRFPSNLRTTLCAIMSSLADEDTILVRGEVTRELRSLGVHKDSDIAGLAKANRDMAAQLDTASAQQKALEPMMKLINALTGNNPLAAQAIADAQQNMTEAANPAALLPQHAAPLPPPTFDIDPSEDEVAIAQQQLAQRSALAAFSMRESVPGQMQGPPPGAPKPTAGGH